MVTSTILKPSDLASGGFFTGNTRLQLNLVTESASGSVAGRVRGHDVVDGSLHPASKRHRVIVSRITKEGTARERH